MEWVEDGTHVTIIRLAEAPAAFFDLDRLNAFTTNWPPNVDQYGNRFRERSVDAWMWSNYAIQPADPKGGGGFAEWAMLTFHALCIELGKSYRGTVDLLSEMPGILEEIGLTRLPHYTVLRTWFARIPTATWRAFLGVSAEKRTGHAAIDSTGFDRDQPSRHYANYTHYRVRALKGLC